MSYVVDRFAEAVAFAAKVHAGQIYRGYGDGLDSPYILHPLRVALAVEGEARTVAVLHDVLEDCCADEDLPGFLTHTEILALQLLTRDKNEENYEDYIGILASVPGLAGELARTVKIADLRDNLAHEPPPRLRSRYEAALAILESNGGET